MNNQIKTNKVILACSRQYIKNSNDSILSLFHHDSFSKRSSFAHSKDWIPYIMNVYCLHLNPILPILNTYCWIKFIKYLKFWLDSKGWGEDSFIIVIALVVQTRHINQHRSKELINDLSHAKHPQRLFLFKSIWMAG